MTERGLPIADGAPACPFVAFEDDRDERATSPDHRHRCYAEPNPAPRALAHQEAYCLSPAFPVCPTFQDWARREAARSRGERPPSAESEGPMAAGSRQRNPPRSWAAPPPWGSGAGTPAGASAGAAGAAGGLWDAGEGDEADAGMAEEAAATPAQGVGLSGSYADRVAAKSDAPSAGGSAGAAVPSVPTATTMGPPAAGGPRSGSASHERKGAWHGPETSEQASVRAAAESRSAPTRRRERDASRLAAFGGSEEPRGRRLERRRDPATPEWERARPAEAYPTLRSRRLPALSVPPLLVAVIALALAAAVLFALPGLLGFGNPTAVATPTPAARPSAGASVAPTPIPPPTPQVYIVQSGDTMSRIANRFGIPLGDLIAANKEAIPNPDQLQVGDPVIIPLPVPTELPAPSELPAAT